MATAPPFSVVVDDTDPGITYAGTWVTDNGSFDGSGDGISGPEYNGTLHGTMANGTSASFTFHGVCPPHVLLLPLQLT
jgi:hypothetical protein